MNTFHRAARIAGAITIALWLMVTATTALAFTIDPAAINAALGIGFWAIIGTATTAALQREARRP